MQLRPYQERGRHDIYREWDLSDILFFQLATGGGKTVIFVEVIRDFLLRGLRCMLVAHREELIGNAYGTLYQNKILAGIIQGGFPTNYSLPAQVCSIQTIIRRKDLPHADLIVIDEGHHVRDDNSYGKILQRYPNAKILIVSATPYRLSGEGFLNLVPGKITRLIINSTLRDLIADGWLSPIKFFASHIPDLQQVELNQGDYKEDQAYEAMKLAPIVESWETNAKNKQGITFACNVNHSISIVQQYARKGVPSEHLDANTPSEDYERNGVKYLGRRGIIRDFNAGLIKVVSNVGILTEGTDFPNCEFIQLARPTKSLSLYLQMVGRGTRPLKSLNIDQYLTSEARREAIQSSGKPHCIVLDNAGLCVEHFLPEFSHNWESYFIGTKEEGRKKKAAPVPDMDMLVYVAEDALGNRVKTRNPKEIEGMQLIEITQEIKNKLFSIKALKEFDRIYLLYKSQYSCKRPGIMAVKKYIDYCESNRILMVEHVWNYLNDVLITQVQRREQDLITNRVNSPNQYPDSLYRDAVTRIAASGVTTAWLLEERDKYCRRNKTQLMDYANTQLKVNI